MKNVLIIVVAVFGALGILALSIYLLRKSRLINKDSARGCRYIRLSQTADQVTESQCLVSASTDEEDDEEDDDESSPATIDVESRTIKVNGTYRGTSHAAANETDEELLQ
uniref:Putative secreted protein n=1 Tax=Ornithodoros turicata TaxID=34597 RepID=A0A2R5LCT3_9ACAR